MAPMALLCAERPDTPAVSALNKLISRLLYRILQCCGRPPGKEPWSARNNRCSV